MNGDIQNQIGNNTTSSSPFVAAGDVIYFRGTNNKLYKVNSDGSGLTQIGNNSTNSTPFVTPDGWVWFQGTNDELLKVFNDGTQLSRPGANDCASSPTIVNNWVYFQGKDNQLYRMDTLGSAQSQIGKQTTKSKPFVTPDGWVWFQGTNGELLKIFNDGSQLSRPGANDCASSPTVVGNWVYFQGKDNQLYQMDAAGSAQTQIGKQTTKSTPFVTPEGWVYFQGTDDHLYRIFNDGTQLSRPGANDTYSSPFVGQVEISEGTVGEWIYFQSVNNALTRLFQPVDPVATGTLRPKYYLLSVMYSPPGFNGGQSTSGGQTTSVVSYSTGSTLGTTSSVSSSFKNTFSVGASLQIGGFKENTNSLTIGGTFTTSTTTTDQTSENTTKSETVGYTVQGPSADGINHDNDVFLLMMNPLVTVAVYPGNNILWTMGVDGEIMTIVEPFVGWLKNPSLMASVAPGLHQALNAAGLTTADYTQILSANPFANGASSIDPNRFLPTGQSIPYEPPESATGSAVAGTQSFQNTFTVTQTHTVQNQYTVAITLSASLNFLGFLKLGLNSSDSMEWTNTSSLGTSSESQQSASATVGGPAIGFSGPPDVLVYWDTIYNSFMFAFPTTQPTATGSLLDSAGKPVANQAVTLTAGGHMFKTLTNAKGQYRIYGAPNGNGSLGVKGQNFTVTVGSGAAPPTLRLH